MKLNLLLSPWVQSLGWALLHFLWQGSAVALALKGLLVMLRRHSAQARYLAACGAMVLLVLAPAVTFGKLSRDQRLLTPAVASLRPGSNLQPSPLPGESGHPTIVFRSATLEPQRASALQRWLEAHLEWLVLGWLTGVMLVGGRTVLGCWEVKRLGRHCTLVTEPEWEERFRQLTRRLRVSRPVRLMESTLVRVPMAFGWLRPLVLLPVGCLIRLTPEQLEAILAHELAHLRRQDYLVNLAQSVVETLLFYHPAVWWVSGQIRAEREHCCDDQAVATCQDTLAYARALASLEEWRSAPGQLQLAATGGPLLTRVRRLLGRPVENRLGGGWVVGMLSIVVLLVLLVAPRGWLLAQPEPAPSTPTSKSTPPIASPNTAESASSKTAQVLPQNQEPDAPDQPDIAASTLVSDGRLLFEMGKLDEAEKKLREAVRRNPDDRNALYYLSLIEEARYGQEERKREISAKLLATENSSSSTATAEGSPTPNPWAKTNLVRPSAGRQLIYQRLEKIVLNDVLYDGLPLREVVRDLNEQARKRDPAGRGINIIINPDSDANGSGPSTGEIDPVTGQPLPPKSIADTVIRLHLVNTALLWVIDAVAKAAEVPLHYSVEDYAVVFSRESTESAAQLYTRTFKLDPEKFAAGIRERTGNAGAQNLAQPDSIATALRTLFENAGLDFGRNIPSMGSGKDARLLNTDQGEIAVFYNDRTGLLLVRATLEDLDVVEKVVQICNSDPPQVRIDIKFSEVDSSELQSFGLDPNSELSAGDMNVTVTNWNGVVTEQRAFEPSHTIQSFIQAKPQLLPGRARIITETQARAMLKQLGEAGGDVLAAPRVTTLSGREAQIEVLELRSIVLLAATNARPSGPSGSFTTKTAGTGPCVNVFPQVIDVIPHAPGQPPMIDLTAIPSWTEFLGYDDPGPFRPVSDSAGLPIVDRIPLPHFRIRQSTLRTSIPSGHTLVVIGFGDAPGSRTRPSGKAAKQLVVFITPTIIN